MKNLIDFVQCFSSISILLSVYLMHQNTMQPLFGIVYDSTCQIALLASVALGLEQGSEKAGLSLLVLLHSETVTHCIRMVIYK